MSRSESPRELPRPALLIAGAVFAIGLFRLVGLYFAHDFVLDLGSVGYPAPRYAAFLMTWCAFGTFAAALLTFGMAQLALRQGAADRFAHDWQAASDRRFVTSAALFALALALGVSLGVLRGARLTDDEPAYLFMSELLASGRLSAPSHAMKVFFDNAFMINDGRLYAKYFIGWPLLLAPGTAIGLPQLMNPLYFALTVPALYAILKHYVSVAWARAGVVLMISAPMLVVGAATRLSHTSCMCVLAWVWVFLLRATRAEARLQDHFGFAALCALACFIRPNSALGIALPLAIAWLIGLRQQPGSRRVAALAAMALTAALAIGVLLLVNQAQTGDPFKIAYARSTEYDAEIGHRYAAFDANYAHTQFEDPLRALAMSGVGLLRLNFDLLGWSIGLLPVVLALGLRRARLPFAMLASFVLINLPMTDAGIDTFGPVHYFEVALPLLVLCVLGFERTGEALQTVAGGAGRVWLPSAFAALIVCGWLGYFPVRAQALVRMTQDILTPEEAASDANLHRAVVFVPRPWGAMCRGAPTQNFAFFRPNNDPDLKNDVLWVNNLSLTENRKFMQHFPDRQGYVLLRRRDCTAKLLPLAKVSQKLADSLPMK